MNTVNETAKVTAVAAVVDVLVCGGGPAGFAAALSSARTGAKTMLIESSGMLGGIWTTGLMPYILDWNNKTGIMAELINELDKREARRANAIDSEQMKFILEQFCTSAGVIIQFNTRIVDVIKNNDNEITHVIAESKSGRQAFEAKVFIDTTGDGDVGLLSGCEFYYGKEATGETQPQSMNAIVSGIDFDEVEDFLLHDRNIKYNPKAKANFLCEINRAGATASYAAPCLYMINSCIFGMGVNHEYGVSGLNALDTTKAVIRARQEVNNIVDKLRALGGVWKNLRLINTSTHMGVRDGRRIKGLYTVTAEDLVNGKEQEDAACRVTFPVDVHSLDPSKGKAFGNEGYTTKPYDIPLRALIAKDVKRLMMAGRCISGDFISHASYRQTGNAVPMGEAAGKVAASAALRNVLPQEVEYTAFKGASELG